MVCRFSDYECSVFHPDEFVTQGFAWGDTEKLNGKIIRTDSHC